MKSRKNREKGPANLCSPHISHYFLVLLSHLKNILLRCWNRYYDPFEKKKEGESSVPPSPPHQNVNKIPGHSVGAD